MQSPRTRVPAAALGTSWRVIYRHRIPHLAIPGHASYALPTVPRVLGSPAPSLPAVLSVWWRPGLAAGADLSGGYRDHQRRQARFTPSCAVMADHAEQRPHMTRQHAPSNSVAELSVGDDLTVPGDVDKDGACCKGGPSQSRSEAVHPFPHRETVTDGDGERLRCHDPMIRATRVSSQDRIGAPHSEVGADQLAMRRRTRMIPPPVATAASARTMAVMLAPVSGRRPPPAAAAAAASWP